MTTQPGLTAGALRSDFKGLGGGKSSRRVKCKPPNTQCGGRCIPAEWDCRLKGEGSDPHLRAVKTDPLGGAASIERGIKRIFKGAPKGSFSEVQGGIGSIVRGTVKISPGDIQQKKKLKEDINENLKAITLGALTLTAGLGLHGLFMRKNTFGYRYGVGRDINESARSGINSILDATPLVGRQRIYTRQAANASGASIRGRMQTAATQSPAAVLTDLSRGKSQLASTKYETSNVTGNGALSRSLAEANETAKKGSLNFSNWNQRSRENFWSTKVQYEYDSRNKAAVNVFAEPAAKDYLAKQFKLTAEEQSNDVRIRDAIREKMQIEKDTMIDQAEALGFSVTRTGTDRILKEQDIKPFVEQFTRDQLGKGNYSAKFVSQYESKIAKILQDKTISTTARDLYNDTVEGFNHYFTEVSKRIKSIPGAAPIGQDQRREGYGTLLRDADQLRASILSRQLNVNRAIEGPAHIDLINLTYYHNKAIGTAKSPYGVSDRLAQAAATELAKRPVNSTAEAFNLLNNEYGFKNARPIRATRDPFKKQVAAKPRTQAKRAVKLKSEQELIETYLKSGYSRPAAENAAKKAILEREKRAAQAPKPPERGDQQDIDLAVHRSATYLATRARLDKRCGKSGIPDTKKCSKPTAAQSEAARNRERGLKTPGLTCTPPNKQCGNLCIPATATCHINSGGALKTGAAVALTAGAGILALRNRRLIQTTARSGIIKANRNIRGASAKLGRTKVGTKVRRKSAAAVRYSTQWRARYERMNPQQRRRLIGATIARGSREARLATGSLGGLAAIKGLSSKQVSDGIERLPEEWRPKARNLVGKAKAGAAQIQLESQGFKIKDIDEDNNFSIWRNQKGDIRMVSSVDDTLINFNAKRVRQGNFFEGTGRPTYDVAFLTDQSFDQKQNIDPESGTRVISRVRQLFDQARQEMPRGEVILTNTPYKNDGKGEARAAIYKRARFNYLPDRDDVQWAVMRDREMVRLSKDDADDLFDEIMTENNPFDNEDFDPDVDGEDFEMDKADAYNTILRTDSFKRGINSPRVQTYLHTRARFAT